ncbi:MAG: hypothetical protein ACXABY_29535 [Candidatus Thorarchaeota archaeon]|jgi:hypothetical protein
MSVAISHGRKFIIGEDGVFYNLNGDLLTKGTLAALEKGPDACNTKPTRDMWAEIEKEKQKKRNRKKISVKPGVLPERTPKVPKLTESVNIDTQAIPLEEVDGNTN